MLLSILRAPDQGLAGGQCSRRPADSLLLGTEKDKTEPWAPFTNGETEAQ